MIGLFHEITDNYIDRVCALAEKRINSDMAGRVREFLQAMKDAYQPAPQILEWANYSNPYTTMTWRSSYVCQSGTRSVVDVNVTMFGISIEPNSGGMLFHYLPVPDAVKELAPILFQLAKDDTPCPPE